MNYKKHVDETLSIFDKRKKLFQDKNDNYGCSYIKAGEILELIFEGNPVVLKNSHDHISYQLITRKLDKLIRYCNLRFTEQSDKVGEKLNDTMSDDGVYSFMAAEIDLHGIEQNKGCGDSCTCGTQEDVVRKVVQDAFVMKSDIHPIITQEERECLLRPKTEWTVDEVDQPCHVNPPTKWPRK